MKFQRLATAVSVSAMLTATAVVWQGRRVEAAAVTAPALQLPTRFFAQAAAPAPAPSAPAAASSSAPQSLLPDGKDRDLTEATCGGCHSVAVFSDQRHTNAEWSNIIDDMIGHGLTAQDEDITKINTYLATYMGPPKAATPPAATAPASAPAPAPNSASH